MLEQGIDRQMNVTHENHTNGAQIESPRILYVDNEPAKQKTFKSLFENGIEILCANSGKKGLEILEEKVVHVVIAGLEIPDMHAVEFLNKAKSKWADLKYVLCAPYHDNVVIQKVEKDVAICWYIGKTFDEEKLLHIIKKEIDSYQSDILRRDTEDKSRGVLDSMIDAFSRRTMDGEITIISPSIYNITGYKSEEVIGHNILEYYVDPRQEELLRQKIIKDKDVRNFELEIYKKDGGIITISVNAKLFCDHKGNPTYIDSVFRDITENKKLLEKSIESEKRFKALSEASFEAIFISKKGICIEQNTQAEKMFGYTLSEAIGRKGIEWIKPEDHEMVMNNILSGYEKPYEATALRKDGSTFPVEIRGKMMHFKGGDVRVTTLNDISERKLAESKLRQSELKYRQLVNNSIVGVFTTTLDGRFLFVNEAIVSMYDFESSEKMLAEGSLARWKDPKQREHMLTLLKQHGSVTNFEAETITNSGRNIHVIFSVKKQDDHIMGMVMDITDRKKAEEKLEQSERILKASQQMAHVGNWVWEIEKDIITWSEEVYRIYGIAPGTEVTYDRLMEAIHPEDREYHNKQTAKWLKNKTAEPYEYRVMSPDGSLKRVYAIGDIECDDSGNPLRLNGTVQDITQLKRAISEHNKLFNVSFDLLCIAGFDGYFKELNPFWAQVTGYSLEELYASPFSEFIHPDDLEKSAAEIQELFKGKRPTIGFENRYITKSGKEIHLSWTVTPAPEEKLMYCIARDITDRKLAEIKIDQYQQRLKGLANELTISEEKIRKQIAIDLHDHVGQMLSSIRMQLARITNMEENQEIIVRMNNISQGLLKSIQATRDAIFDLSPPQLNEIGLYAAVHDWIKEQIERKHHIATEINAKQEEFHLEENTRYLVFRSIKELLMNVVKHAEAKKVKVAMNKKDTMLEICVEDDGIGFYYNPDLLKVTSKSYGLFSIQERISDMGGAMEIESKIDKGTKVKLCIPIKTIQP